MKITRSFEKKAHEPGRNKFRLKALALLIPLLLAGCSSDGTWGLGGSDVTVDPPPSIPAATSWSFAVVCDSRAAYETDNLPAYYDATYGISPFYKNVALALSKETGIDFAFFPGDLMRGKKPTLTGAEMAADLDKWKTLTQPVEDAGIPVYTIRGNHDANEVSDPTGANGNAVTIWKSHITQPTNNPIVQDTGTQSGLTYAFTHNGALFVGIDEYVGGLTYDQQFLNSQLARPAEHKFVFAHQPVWNYKSDELGPAGLDDDLNNGDVDLLFTGHVHNYQRIAKEGYGFQEMIVGTAGAPENDPTLQPGDPNFEADPDLSVLSYAGGTGSNAKFGYAIITVNTDGSISTKMKFLDDPTSPSSAVSTFDSNTISDNSSIPWKFAVMSDTQWTTADPAGENPNGVPVSIINQLNPEFIKERVKFVVQVGDLTEEGNDADEIVRANAAQPLYDAGIGYFPMRGNHETYANPVNNYNIPQLPALYPQTQGLSNTFGAFNFNSPTSVSSDLNGLSYSFDYNNARFVVIDPFATPSKIDNNADGYAYGYTIADQQSWINSRLDMNSRGTDHAFVFSHQPLIAENHQDTMFSGYTNQNLDWQNAFYASLQDNDVKYFMSGHDHIHQRSIVTSPDNQSSVQELIGASNSSKFYTPKPLDDAKWYGQKDRETSLSQEAYTVGYYIYTVDGPRVTVDYYSDDHGNWKSDANYPNGAGLPDTNITPTFHFVKKESWGYSLNGHEFLVAQGQPYTTVQETYSATTAKILDGTNNSTKKDISLNTTGGVGRSLTKAVDTGWSDKTPETASNILTLWGMTDLGAASTDTFVLSMNYDSTGITPQQLQSGAFGLATKDANGNWVNAVDTNVGGTKLFVAGPWNSSYPLGAYGVDSATHTAWAVINHEKNFSVATYSH